MDTAILHFPHPAQLGASWWHRKTSRVREQLSRLANWIKLPGAVANTRIEDSLTSQVIEIRTGVLFTRISVNGRDYYFRRFSGVFDGTGSGCTAGTICPLGENPCSRCPDPLNCSLPSP